ncbi:p18 [Alphabaculovirus altersperidaniae]|uniref:P18 n=1 Tax=Spodoptera eridania nucleopolyhedrovirus TaxID=2315721 RepID=A0ABX6TQ90_9ABAC|nr:p18 [Spodoptera eridania nucleopolyhedrovirus]QNV47883.1 p18 [Spodoptera eridania nucleopolyhedrovirus]
MNNNNAIYLYLIDMPEGVNNDKPNDDDVIYFGGIIECVDDESCDKFSLLSELKKEEALFMRKTFNDLLEHNNGNYCKNHVLIDALLMYKTYVELVDDSAFGVNILNYCVEHLTNLFKLFRTQSRIIIVLPSHINWEEDNLSALLKHLLHNSIIEIASK